MARATSMAPLVPFSEGVNTISAPYSSRRRTRSSLAFSGITAVSLYPLRAATMASEMPVFPEVGSRITDPGCSFPSTSAAFTMARAIRSLSDPVGFCPSSLAHRRTPGFGERRSMPTSGVSPMASRMSFARIRGDYRSGDRHGDSGFTHAAPPAFERFHLPVGGVPFVHEQEGMPALDSLLSPAAHSGMHPRSGVSGEPHSGRRPLSPAHRWPGSGSGHDRADPVRPTSRPRLHSARHPQAEEPDIGTPPAQGDGASVEPPNGRPGAAREDRPEAALGWGHDPAGAKSLPPLCPGSIARQLADHDHRRRGQARARPDPHRRVPVGQSRRGGLRAVRHPSVAHHRPLHQYLLPDAPDDLRELQELEVRTVTSTSSLPGAASPHVVSQRACYRSERIARAAFAPGPPVTPPPGCAPEPHRYRPRTARRYLACPRRVRLGSSADTTVGEEISSPVARATPVTRSPDVVTWTTSTDVRISAPNPRAAEASESARAPGPPRANVVWPGAPPSLPAESASSTAVVPADHGPMAAYWMPRAAMAPRIASVSNASPTKSATAIGRTRRSSLVPFFPSPRKARASLSPTRTSPAEGFFRSGGVLACTWAMKLASTRTF